MLEKREPTTDASSTATPANPETRPQWATSALFILGTLAAAHFLLDLVATTINPLLPTLEKEHGKAEGGFLWVMVLWTVSTSIFQFVFGWIGDRWNGRWMLWAGPMVAVVGLSSIGWATSPAMLAVMVVISGWGVAAFHPEGAATAGALVPEWRSRLMAIFALSGYLGQSVGPVYSGWMVDSYQLTGLVWTIAWALPVMILIAGALWKPVPTSKPLAAPEESPIAPTVSAKTLALLLAVGVLRIVPALGVTFSMPYILKPLGASNVEIGFVQSLFMAGLGSGGVLCAYAVAQQHERRVLVIMPLCAAPVLCSLLIRDSQVLHVGTAAAGFVLGVAMPVFISYGQRLLPHGQRVASSITMGVSWGISSGIVALLIHIMQKQDALRSIFAVFAISAVASGLLTMTLPRVDESNN